MLNRLHPYQITGKQHTWLSIETGSTVLFVNVKTSMTDSQLKDAFEIWALRTKKANVDLFCAYINNKNAGFECNKV
jgi:hypothetical protein